MMRPSTPLSSANFGITRATKYDPNEHHGPSLFYATLAFERLTAAPDLDHYTDARLRLGHCTFWPGLAFASSLDHGRFGPSAIIWAALFTAASPALVFYSRYFIHEMLLVFFTFPRSCLWVALLAELGRSVGCCWQERHWA